MHFKNKIVHVGFSLIADISEMSRQKNIIHDRRWWSQIPGDYLGKMSTKLCPAFFRQSSTIYTAKIYLNQGTLVDVYTIVVILTPSVVVIKLFTSYCKNC